MAIKVTNPIGGFLTAALEGAEVEEQDPYYMDAVDADYDIDSDDEREGKELLDGIEKADEFLTGMESLIATMEAAQADPQFGKYNLPLYHKEAVRLHKLMGLSTFGMSTENFESEYVLSTEGFKETASKVWEAFKAMVKRFLDWLLGKSGKESKAEKAKALAEKEKQAVEEQVKKPEFIKMVKEVHKIDFEVTLKGVLGEHVRDHDSFEKVKTAVMFAEDDLQKSFEKVADFFSDIAKAESEEEVDGMVVGHGLTKDPKKTIDKKNVKFSWEPKLGQVLDGTLGEVGKSVTVDLYLTAVKESREKLEKVKDDIEKRFIAANKEFSGEFNTQLSKFGDPKQQMSAAKTDELHAEIKLLAAQRKAIVKAIGYLSKTVHDYDLFVNDCTNIYLKYKQAVIDARNEINKAD